MKSQKAKAKNSGTFYLLALLTCCGVKRSN